MSLQERWTRWRNRLIASPVFQRRASAFPLTRPVAQRHAGALFDVVAGFVYAQVARAAVELNLLNILHEAPQTPEQIATRCDLPLASAEILLKAAASLDLTERLSDGRYTLGQAGAALHADPGIQAMIQHHDALYADLADPVALLRQRGGGALADYWPYGSANPESAARYSALMSATQPMIADQVLDAYNFEKHRKLLDIGGGEGAFVQAVGARHPGLALSLMDLPDVAARVQSADIEAHAGSFKTDPLPVGADCISLVRILHDHDDADVKTLLAKVAAALPKGGTLIIAEPMADTPGARPMGHAYFGFYLLAMGSGRPRTAGEYRAMLDEAGFTAVHEARTRLPLICRVIVAQI